MIAEIGHRGPDATGIHVEPGGAAGLAHARLSIIDLATGDQPMASADGSVWIVFNGEIFNYLELRAELERTGRTFATQSDTEVILQMYEVYGESCVERFNGDWAFAIWDRRESKLFLSRDRVGVRPLYYAATPRAFVFASEVKSVLAHGGVERTLDLRALDEVFTFWAPLAPRTCFAQVRELPPGHCLTLRDGRVRLWRYWSLRFDPEPQRLADDEAAERLLSLLADASRIRLRSDVPVGAYLSGGLDSSFVTALVNGIAGTRLRTFSVTFDDAEFDESAFQQAVVQRLGTEHQSIRCTYDDICTAFPDVVWHAEKPLLRAAPAPLFLLSKLVRDASFKVVLTGEGADEFLGGYDIFKEEAIRRFWARQPHSQWRPSLLRRLYPYLPEMRAQSEAYLKRFFRVEPEQLDNPFFSHLPRWTVTAKAKQFYSEDLRLQLASDDPFADLRSRLPDDFSRWSGLGRAQYLEADILLPGYILSSQGDRMAMAHSVEGRFPFLDHRVVEFANALPARLKLRGLQEKYLLKRAARHLVPDAVFQRPKQPYRAPDARSFFDAAAGRERAQYVADVLSPRSVEQAGLFNPRAVGRLVEKARAGQVVGAGDNMALVGILSTQLLVRQFTQTQGKTQ